MLDRLHLLNSVDRSKTYPDIEPRDAVSVILVDRSSDPFRVLMGQRHASHDFMPGVFVFPGGAVEDDDIIFSRALSDSDCALFSFLQTDLIGSACSSAPCWYGAALLRCGLRELFEETGVRLDEEADVNGFPPVGRFIFIARALTPPGRRKRFDTRFFLIDYSGPLGSFSDTDELSHLQWVNYNQAIDLPLHAMTRVILEDVNDLLLRGSTKSKDSIRLSQPGMVPFYKMEAGQFVRPFLEIQSSS